MKPLHETVIKTVGNLSYVRLIHEDLEEWDGDEPLGEDQALYVVSIELRIKTATNWVQPQEVGRASFGSVVLNKYNPLDDPYLEEVTADVIVDAEADFTRLMAAVNDAMDEIIRKEKA